MKQVIKEAVGSALFAGAPRALVLRRGALVVAFHRVLPGDRGDDLTVTTVQFERWCSVFARAFSPVTLADLTARLQRGRSVSGLVAITFDDGYADNFEYAAPILERHGLPATFFITTKWIETDAVAWWDSATPTRHGWMTWRQVHALRARGFDIGAHTRTHVDLGAVSEDIVRSEILGSQIDIEQRLGSRATAFAYPYGRPSNITAAARTLVRDAGFSCCCSAFGGVNGAATDPFAILRVPINTHSPSPHQLGFDIAFGRTQLGV